MPDDPQPTLRDRRIRALADDLSGLSDSQLAWTEAVLRQFRQKPILERNLTSDLVTPCVLEMFGDALQIHHCLSTEALSKDRFEYALEGVLNRCGIPSVLAPKGNPGHDITIRGVPVSLKTQADRALRRDVLHVSKLMELGKGAWAADADLIGLREQFFRHLRSYERILQLRRLTNEETLQEYELVEIPKGLLLQARTGVLRTVSASRQVPKPGYCTVADADGRVLFHLYFDGGTERKLQLKGLRKELCIVHAQWGIRRILLTTEPARG